MFYKLNMDARVCAASTAELELPHQAEQPAFSWAPHLSLVFRAMDLPSRLCYALGRGSRAGPAATAAYQLHPSNKDDEQLLLDAPDLRVSVTRKHHCQGLQ